MDNSIVVSQVQKIFLNVYVNLFISNMNISLINLVFEWCLILVN